jgi:hypothetical protein
VGLHFGDGHRLRLLGDELQRQPIALQFSSPESCVLAGSYAGESAGRRDPFGRDCDDAIFCPDVTWVHLDVVGGRRV